jgi:hypothetical protein
MAALSTGILISMPALEISLMRAIESTDQELMESAEVFGYL